MTTATCFRRFAILAAIGAMLATGLGATCVRADVMISAVDGYSAMGGMIYYTDSNQYLLAGNPASPPSGTMGTWGYAWLKFGDLPTGPVASATLKLQSITQAYGGMYQVPENVPVDLGVYPAASDVALLTNSSAAQSAFRASLIGATPVDTVYVTGGDGFYELDVTSIVNGWVASGDNHGLVIASLGESIPRFHSRETTTGAAPAIVTTVPEPAAIMSLGMGLIVLGAGRLVRAGRRAGDV